MLHVGTTWNNALGDKSEPQAVGAPGLYPEPDIVTVVDTGPDVGVSINVDMTVNDVVALSPPVPLKVNMSVPPNALEVTVNVHPAPIVPPTTEHVRVKGAEYKLPGPPVTENETAVSPELKPDPVTVTDVPVGPLLGESETVGTVTMNAAETDPWMTLVNPPPLVSFTVWGPGVAPAATVGKLPVRTPFASTAQFCAPENIPPVAVSCAAGQVLGPAA
jgi:hypothetical protein